MPTTHRPKISPFELDEARATFVLHYGAIWSLMALTVLSLMKLSELPESITVDSSYPLTKDEMMA